MYEVAALLVLLLGVGMVSRSCSGRGAACLSRLLALQGGHRVLRLGRTGCYAVVVVQLSNSLVGGANIIAIGIVPGAFGSSEAITYRKSNPIHLGAESTSMFGVGAHVPTQVLGLWYQLRACLTWWWLHVGPATPPHRAGVPLRPGEGGGRRTHDECQSWNWGLLCPPKLLLS